MKHFVGVVSVLIFLLAATAGSAQDNSFDSEKMLEDLEQKLELSKEKLQSLKPTIDAKSEELKKLMQESMDKGYLQLEEMHRALQELAAESESKMESVLNSEQVRKLKDYMSRVDKEAIRNTQKKLVDEISELLDLTEEQLSEIKPLLEDSVARLGGMISELKAEGSRNWEAFKRQYEQMSQDLKEKLEEKLDRDQIEKLEKYQEDRKKPDSRDTFCVIEYLEGRRR